MYYHKKLSSLLCSAFLFSCYTSTTLAQSVKAEEKATAGQVDVQDQSFRNALVATYEGNPRIIAQRKAFEASGEGFNQALAGWLPSITLDYDKGRRRQRFADRVGQDDWQYLDSEDRRLNVSQSLVRVDTYFAMEQADNIIKQNGAQLIGVTQEVLLDGISRYLDVVRDREVLRLSRNNETVLKQQLDATQERFDLGEATKTDLSQSEARLSRAESDTIQAMGNLAITEAAFARVVGFNPENDFVYPQKVPAVPDSMEKVVEEALKNNPALISAKYAEEAADDLVDVNTTRLLPTATLRGSMSRSKGGFLGAFDSDEALVNVNLPLYQGGADYSRIRESKTIKSQRRYDVLQRTNETREQAISAWEQYQTTLAAIEAQKATIEAAEVALDGVKQEQLYGSRTVLDVLDAEQELFVARVNMARSERNLLVSLYSILSVTGQLSPANLALGIKEYDQAETISDIKYQIIGF
jgi:TolC family type I secretion outer membrane protein